MEAKAPCDITLVTKDGKEFKAHRNVLSAASLYFNTLLQIEMRENREGIVRFEEISGSIMENVLQFIYTGSVEVTQDNSKDLIATADYLLMTELKTVSGRFLQEQMSESNCISTFYFGEKYQCDELIVNSRKFIYENFASVAEMEEFLNLEAKEVERWISSDEIIVACGGKYTLCYLPDKDKWKRLADGPHQDVDRDKNMVNFRDQLYVFPIEAVLKLDQLDVFPPKKVYNCDQLYVFSTAAVFNRDPPEDVYGNGIAEKYNPVYDSWSTSMPCYHRKNVTVVRGEICAFEVDSSAGKSTIFKYDDDQCSWLTVLSSPKGCRTFACVVSAGDHLYVLGGYSPQSSWEHVARSERFDTVENKWEEIADMQEARGGAFGVASHGKIFVAEGKRYNREDFSNVNTCEMYNISTNEWQFIASLNVYRECGSMVCLRGTLYVLGGSEDIRKGEYCVECYDPTEYKWVRRTTIPVKQILEEEDTFAEQSDITFVACALKLSKGVLDKAHVV